MPKLSVDLPKSLHAAIDERVASGEYSDRGAYLRALVRRDQQRHQRRDLEQMLLGRLNRSGAVEMNSADFVRMRHRLMKRVAKNKRA